MSVQELNRVHRRYIRVSNYFKSAWTFHQFIQGLHKVFSDLQTPHYPADFQSIYGDLKEISQNLSETTTEAANTKLDEVEQKLAPMVQALLSVDEQVSPGLLRLFFQRVKNYDDNILTQLVKFYLYSKDGDDWNFDRLDKADFLSTKLAEEYNDMRDVFVQRDPTFVREVAQSFWAALGGNQVSEIDIETLREEIRSFVKKIEEADSMDDLHKRRLIPEYRDVKHRLGDVYFQPKVLQAVLETNLALKNLTQRLYRREEQRIIAEYQQVFELERDVPVDVQLGEELSQFRSAVERFEQQLQGENVRLDELANLRQKVRELMPKLQPEQDPAETGPFVQPPEVREMLEDDLEATNPAISGEGLSPEFSYVEEAFSVLVQKLDDTNPTVDPRKIILQPEIFGLGLGAREVVAYRRLFGGMRCDRELEHFVLRSAALRSVMEDDVEDIKGILDDSAVSRESPAFTKARRSTRIGDYFLRVFDHRLEQAVLAGDVSEARSLQHLRVRLMRTYSGLWLMVYRN